jgi:hypothetical protein
METFAPLRRLEPHASYDADRERVLARLDLKSIDAPIRDVVERLAGFSFCFPLQSCFGHFVHSRAPGLHNLGRLPKGDPGPVTYRIAYLALCIRDDPAGRNLLSALSRVPLVAPEYVQLGCPEWFWKRQVNSFALQVEPERFKDRDRAILAHAEALVVEEIRDRFFAALHDVIQ